LCTRFGCRNKGNAIKQAGNELHQAVRLSLRAFAKSYSARGAGFRRKHETLLVWSGYEPIEAFLGSIEKKLFFAKRQEPIIPDATTKPEVFDRFLTAAMCFRWNELWLYRR